MAEKGDAPKPAPGWGMVIHGRRYENGVMVDDNGLGQEPEYEEKPLTPEQERAIQERTREFLLKIKMHGYPVLADDNSHLFDTGVPREVVEKRREFIKKLRRGTEH